LTDDTLGEVVANDDTVPFKDAVEKIVLTSDASAVVENEPVIVPWTNDVGVAVTVSSGVLVPATTLLDEIEGEELKDGATEVESVIMLEPEELTVTLNNCTVDGVTPMLTVVSSLTIAEKVTWVENDATDVKLANAEIEGEPLVEKTSDWEGTGEIDSESVELASPLTVLNSDSLGVIDAFTGVASVDDVGDENSVEENTVEGEGTSDCESSTEPVAVTREDAVTLSVLKFESDALEVTVPASIKDGDMPADCVVRTEELTDGDPVPVVVAALDCEKEGGDVLVTKSVLERIADIDGGAIVGEP
jgi:hypothetical protein